MDKTTSMHPQVKQLILDNAVERINDALFEQMMELVQDSLTEALDEILGDTIDCTSNETYDLMLELSSRIAIVALPE